jgi:hypothetical protein
MIFNLIFSWLTLVQIGWIRPVSHIIHDDELFKEFEIHDLMLYGTVYYLEGKLNIKSRGLGTLVKIEVLNIHSYGL